MPRYAIFFRLKGETVAMAMENPSDRSAIVSKLCQDAGGRLESYYWMFGEWDGFAVAKLPDSATAAALSLAVSSTGTFAQIATHELIPVDQINRTLERAKEFRSRYQPIGTAR